MLLASGLCFAAFIILINFMLVAEACDFVVDCDGPTGTVADFSYNLNWIQLLFHPFVPINILIHVRVCRPPTAVHSRRPIQALLILGGLFYIFAIYYSVRLISKFSPFLNDALSMAAVCT